MKTTKTICIWGILWAVVLIGFAVAYADTPPPGIVRIKDSAGNNINAVGGALSVAVTSGSSTVTQGPAGLAAWLVQVTSSALPSGAATQATLSALNAKVTAVNTGAVTIVSSTLPGGAATSAAQTAGNASLSSIDSKIPSGLTVTSGRLQVEGSGASQPITGTVTANIGTTGGLALQTTLASIDGKLNSLGQKTMAASVPITIASNQTALPVSQSGAFTTGRTWNLLNSTDSVNVGNFPASFGRTWNLNSGTDSVTIVGTITADNTANGVTGAPVPAEATQVGGRDPGGLLRSMKVSTTGVISVDGSASTQPVSGTVTANIGTSGSLALNASVTALQVAQGATTAGKNGSLSLWSVTTAAPTYTTGQLHPPSLTTAGALRTDGSGVTQPISALSLPLPTGASTSALQTSGNASLTSIDSKLTAPLSVAQSGTWTTGRTWSLSLGSDSVNAAQSGIWTVQQGATPAAVANAWPVKITDGTNVGAVKAASTAALATDPAQVITFSPNTGLPTGTNSIGSIVNISGIVSLPTGAATAANQTTSASTLTSINGVQSDGTQKTKIVDGANTTIGPVTTLSAINYLPVVTASSATPGSAAVARSIQISGSDGTNARTFLTDTSGRQQVQINNLTATGTITATCLDASINACGAGTTVQVATAGSANVEISTPGGTWSAGVVGIDVSYDGGTTWIKIQSIDGQIGANLNKLFTNWGSSLIADPWVANVAGATHARLRSVTAITGTISVTLSTSNTPQTIQMTPTSLTYFHTNTAATTTVKTGAVRIQSICINTKNANGDSMTVFDNTTNAAPTVAVITANATSIQNCLTYGQMLLGTGLTITTTGTSDWTITYQ